MKRSIAPGAVLLSILVALSFCVAFAESEIVSEDNANVTAPANMTNMTANTTEILSNTTNITLPQNATQTGNATNPFTNAKGQVDAQLGVIIPGSEVDAQLGVIILGSETDISNGMDEGISTGIGTDTSLGTSTGTDIGTSSEPGGEMPADAEISNHT